MVMEEIADFGFVVLRFFNFISSNIGPNSYLEFQQLAQIVFSQ